MKAISGELPVPDDDWAFEIKWDGMRIVAHVEDGSVRLDNANLVDSTVRFPELTGAGGIAAAAADATVILDGEVVAFGPTGVPDFGLLQHRMHVVSAVEARRRSNEMPVTYIAFDLLHLAGLDTFDLPYTDRRQLLNEVVQGNQAVQVPAARFSEGEALLAAAKTQGLEGVMAKRLGSRYRPGVRSPEWRKIKARRQQEFVIGGWSPGEGGRTGRIGALLVGVNDDSGLRYAGKVGTGFRERDLSMLGEALAEIEQPSSPFVSAVPAAVGRVARWVAPVLVAEVAFGEWTADGILRHPSYLGLRNDKDPSEVVREP
jgi:bifunctional non-homologous end joining protein LigD